MAALRRTSLSGFDMHRKPRIAVSIGSYLRHRDPILEWLGLVSSSEGCCTAPKGKVHYMVHRQPNYLGQVSRETERSFHRAPVEVDREWDHGDLALEGHVRCSHSNAGCRADGTRMAVARSDPQDIVTGNMVLRVGRQCSADVDGSAATHRWEIAVERKSFHVVRKGPPDAGADLSQVCCSQSG